MPAAVDSVRVLDFSRDVRENLARLRGFVGFPVQRFDRACDFETRTTELREFFLDVARYRNRLTHAYLEVTAEQLHGFVHRHLGDVERLLAALLSAAGLAPPARKPGSGSSEVREPRVGYRKTSQKPAAPRRVRKPKADG